MITTVVPDLQSRMLTQIVDINAPCSTTWEQQWVEQLCSIQRSSSEYNLIGRGATWTNCDSSVLEYKQHSAHTSRWIPRVNKYNRAHLLSCNCIHSDRTILWHWNCASCVWWCTSIDDCADVPSNCCSSDGENICIRLSGTLRRTLGMGGVCVCATNGANALILECNNMNTKSRLTLGQ